MRRFIPLCIAALLAALPASAADFGSRAMSGWFNVTTPEGWRGRRYMDGEDIFAEEFDANRDGRIDVWRFYRQGVLTSEERDLNGDGKVDYLSRYDPASGNLVAILRDSNRRGVNDIEVEYVGNRRWEVRQDRNLDGISDRIVYVNANQDMMIALDIDPAAYGDISSAVPREYWYEMWSDDGYTGAITDYFRYRRGVLTHYGVWNGRRIAWRRVQPDFIPPGIAPASPAPYDRPAGFRDELADAYRPPAQREIPYPTPPAPGRPPVGAAEEAIRNPFDLSGGYGDYDPYPGMSGPPSAMPRPPEYDRPDEFQDPGRGTPSFGAPPAGAPPPARPAMTELPRNESFARSVPARMRAPGQSAPRR